MARVIRSAAMAMVTISSMTEKPRWGGRWVMQRSLAGAGLAADPASRVRRPAGAARHAGGLAVSLVVQAEHEAAHHRRRAGGHQRVAGRAGRADRIGEVLRARAGGRADVGAVVLVVLAHR